MRAVALDPASPVPPSAQVRDRLAEAIRSGAMAAGTRLPTVRGLAEQLGLAAGTVARAYRDLEADGLVETRGRAGTVVAYSSDTAERELQQAAAAFADRALALGVPADRARALLEAALAALPR